MYICIERYIFTHIKCDLNKYINRHISVGRLLDKRDCERERKRASTRVRAHTGGREGGGERNFVCTCCGFECCSIKKE